MPLHMKTDKEFDRALEWLAKTEQKTKSDVVREAVLGRFYARKRGFEFGALAFARRATSRQRLRPN